MDAFIKRYRRGRQLSTQSRRGLTMRLTAESGSQCKPTAMTAEGITVLIG
jgi:hypothetical protein